MVAYLEDTLGTAANRPPRAERFIGEARERLIAARERLDADHTGITVSIAYFSMFYAARAALSEDGDLSDFHFSTWSLFRNEYVDTNAFDAALFTKAQHAQVAREAGDYQAVNPTVEEADEYVAAAEKFLAAVERMIGS